ncbi:hypothetical protein DFH08DRAFT_799405 [Mycena albidolilacea]|uniref:Uncharacterized protein n=1 Tax=Mycena albidolilacea TaxID=1033008 RepID=A0AAD7ALP9_9AGAR|nr:hypothetical protein DFH08DRAFT_799405 [Mycena albidolilacea]
MFEPVPPEAGFAQPSSLHVPAYYHPDYIPSQFLRREVAAAFQNRSINPGPQYDVMLPILDPQWLIQSATNHRASGLESMRPTMQTLRELHGVSGGQQGEKCTWDKDKLKKSA